MGWGVVDLFEEQSEGLGDAGTVGALEFDGDREPSRAPMTTADTFSARRRPAWAICLPVNLVGRPISRTRPADP